MAEPRRGDLVFLDPPYAATLRGGHTFNYSANTFTDRDQEEVAAQVVVLDRRGCKIMAMNADCSYIRRLYKGFHMTRLLVRRRVGGHAARRGVAQDVLVTNYVP
jgi:DNA adenine methylase